MAGIDVSPQDLDAITRAVVGEAGSEPDDGQAAVAHVILNRISSGKYGKTPQSVIFAPSQFESADNPTSTFYTTYPGAPDYRKAQSIVQGVLLGNIPDPTGGATLFYAPRAQAALGRKPPQWSINQTPSAVIGGHVFYSPYGALKPAHQQADDGPNMGSTDLPALAFTDAPQGQPMAQTTPNAPQEQAAGEDFYSKWGIDPKAVASPSAGSPSAGVTYAGSSQPSAPKDFASRWGLAPEALTGGPSAIPAAPADINNVPTAASDPIYHGAVPVGNAPEMGATTALASGVQGAPIVGPAISGGIQKAAAAARAVANNTRYSDELRNVQEMTDLARSQHPTAATAGDITGNMLMTGAAIGAAPAAFGISDAPVLGRAILGAGTSGAIGGADAAVRGDNALTGASVGALAGGAAPFIGKSIGSTINGVANRLLPINVDGLDRPAVRVLTNALGADTPALVQQEAARLGPQAMLPDLGPSLGGVGQGLAVKPGDAKSILFNALQNRQAGANGRISTDLNKLLGPAEDPQAVTQNILATRATQDARNYAAVHGQNVPVDPSSVVRMIDDQLPTATGAQRTALQTLRNNLVVQDSRPATATAPAQPPVYQTNSRFLHNLRQDIDMALSGEAPALGVQPGALGRQQGTLSAVRSALDNALKTQVPGMAQADAQSAALAARANAVQQGTDILANGKTALSPEGFANAYGNMSPGEQIALNKGARGEINRLVGISSNDPAKLRQLLQGEGGWNTAKLSTAFGSQPTQDLVNAVGREGQFSDTANKLMGNSQTAQRNAAASLLKDQAPISISDLKGVTPTGLVLQAGKTTLADPLLNALFRTNNGTRDAQLGRALSLQGDPRDQLINQLIGALGTNNRAAAVAQLMDRGITGGSNMLIGNYERQQYPDLVVNH